MRQRAGLFAGLLVVAAVTVGTAAAISGLLSTASTTGVRAVLAQQPGSERALRAALPLAGDSPAALEQDRAAQATIREWFRDAAGRGVPSGIVRTVESASIVARGGRRTCIERAKVWDLTSAATLEAGDWAGDASEATMQADAAAALGVGIGDTIVLDEQVELTIVGTWRVDDPDAPRWMGDALWITGGNERSVGPIVVEDTVWDELGITPQVRWTITPETERLAPSDLAAVDTAWETLPSAFRAAELGLPSLTGRFLLSARESQGLVAALQTAAPLALIVLGVLAALAIWELAGLLTRARSAETALLWARGATAHTLATVTAGEAACVAAAGALVGVAVAASLLFALPDALRTHARRRSMGGSGRGDDLGRSFRAAHRPLRRGRWAARPYGAVDRRPGRSPWSPPRRSSPLGSCSRTVRSRSHARDARRSIRSPSSHRR